MVYVFRQGLYHCSCNGYSIILDIRHDRYLSLGDAAHQAVERMIAGELRAGDVPVLDGLVSRSILQESAQPTAPVPEPLAHACKDYREFSREPDRRWIAPAIIAQVGSMISLRIWPLERCLARLAQRRATMLIQAPEKARDRAFAIAAAFRASAVYVSPHDRCLARAMALMTLLIRAGCSSRLVMAVTSRPFRAHCWLEHDGVVLTDELENVRLFTPILAL